MSKAKTTTGHTAAERAAQRKPGENLATAFKRLYPGQPEPSDFHRWFCNFHEIPPEVRKKLEATKASANSDEVLLEVFPDFCHRAEFYEAAAIADAPAPPGLVDKPPAADDSAP